MPAAFEAIAVAVHLDDVDVVGEAIQQGSGEAFGAEDLGPLVEGQVGSNEDGAWTLRISGGVSEGIHQSVVQSGGEFLRIGVAGSTLCNQAA